MVFGCIAQLVRALRSHRRGHKFESCYTHQYEATRALKGVTKVALFLFLITLFLGGVIYVYKAKMMPKVPKIRYSKA